MAEDNSRFYFERELSQITPCTEEEMEELFSRAGFGDKEALSRLVEGNMFRVAEAAHYFSRNKIQYMDLIQEGNMALFLFCSSEEFFDENTPYRMDNAIREAMEDFILQEEDSEKASQELKNVLNLIDEVCVDLTDELDREPTAEEVAAKIGRDPSDVRYLMRIALSAIKKD